MAVLRFPPSFAGQAAANAVAGPKTLTFEQGFFVVRDGADYVDPAPFTQDRRASASELLGDVYDAASFIAASKPTTFLSGVNLAGAEFDTGSLPGQYGTNYAYPPTTDIDYYHGKGMRMFRLPFRWERLQHRVNGPFDAAERARLTAWVAYALGKSSDTRVILDPHNYSGRAVDGVGYQIGTPQLPTSAFVDFWQRLALLYKNEPRVIFCLVNEPTNSSATAWAAISQAAINGIRAVGAYNRIQVSGIAYTGAHSFVANGSAAATAKIVDPANNWCVEVHQYLDGDSSGTSTVVVPATLGRQRLMLVTQWARQAGLKLHLGEFNAGDNAMAVNSPQIVELLRTYDYLIANKDVWESVTFWSGGERWGSNYYFQMDALSGADRPRTLALLARTIDREPLGGAAIQLDFRKQRAYGVGTIEDVLSITQAGRLFTLDAMGRWSRVAPNTLRMSSLGLWTERESANYMQSYGLVPNVSLFNCSVEQAFPAPDGSMNAIKIKDTASNTDHLLSNPLGGSGLSGTNTATYSVFVKHLSGPQWAWVHLRQPDSRYEFNMLQPAANTPDSADGWRRPWRTTTGGLDSARLGFQPDPGSNQGHQPDAYVGGNGAFLFWHQQLELGTFPSSPIITHTFGSPAQRAADVVTAIGALQSILASGAWTIVFTLSWAPDVAVVLPLLTLPTVLGPVVALRRNADFSIGTDWGGTQTTAAPAQGANAYRQSILVAVSSRRAVGRVVVGGEGMPSVAAAATVPLVTDAALIGPAEAFIESIRVYRAFHDTAALDALLADE